MKNTLITNGTIVTAGDSFEGSVLIEGDVITDVFRSPHPDQSADVVIDAHGHYIIPGAIDPHVHLELETPGGRSADDFKTGTKAAIAGGTTTIIDFVTPGRSESLAGALKKESRQHKNHLPTGACT